MNQHTPCPDCGGDHSDESGNDVRLPTDYEKDFQMEITLAMKSAHERHPDISVPNAFALIGHIIGANIAYLAGDDKEARLELAVMLIQNMDLGFYAYDQGNVRKIATN